MPTFRLKQPGIALEFFGALNEPHTYGDPNTPCEMGLPQEGAIDAVNDYLKNGLRVIVRTDEGEATMREWLNAVGVASPETVEVTDKKPPGTVFLDPLAIRFAGAFPQPEEVRGRLANPY